MLFAILIAYLTDAPAASSELEPKKTESEFPNSTARLNNIRINEYISLKDSTERQKQLARFYEKRNNELVWFNNGKLNKNGRELIHQLERADEEGLSGKFYDLPGIKSEINYLKLSEDETLHKLAALDLKLTNAYMSFASDISTGKVNPEDLNVVWETNTEHRNFSEYLKRAIENNKVEESLINLRPAHKQYKLLVEAHKKLSAKKNNGSWILPGNNIPTLEEGDSLPEVVHIKKRLSSSGYLVEDDSSYINSLLFDMQLTLAVKNFQRHHGLKADGVVGANTLAEMNKPIEYRLAQIRLNLDRLRWLPNSVGNRDIIVNIPDYKLQYFENNELAQEMGVVVGKTANYTPALKDTITYLVFNPTWNVPYSIATEEMLPKIKADPSYISRNNFKLLRGSYLSDDEINPDSVNWYEITADNFPFFIVERPGNGNALGRVKFILPNNYSIYLHDTPADHLFNRSKRDFSHGCIRLEKPFLLAKLLLESEMTSYEIDRMLASNETQTVVLDKPVAVHLVYQTAWIDDFGELQFRNDIYGFDRMSFSLLEESNKITPEEIEIKTVNH